MTNKFAFISHSFSLKDLRRSAPTIYNKTKGIAERIVERLPPKEISHITNLVSSTSARAEGWIISVWLLPNQFLCSPSNMVLKKILDAVRIGQKLGAKIVGLGGYNSIVPPGAGLTVARNVSIGVTNGNSYTIAVAIEGMKLAAKKMNIDLRKAAVSVIGATGSIGSVISEIIAKEEIGSLTLVGRRMNRLNGRAQSIYQRTNLRPLVTTSIKEAVSEADLIFSASSSPGSIIDIWDFKPGSIVCDVALPHDISEDDVIKRKDILVFDGGIAKIPPGYKLNPDISKDLDLPKGHTFACFCETAILALDGHFDHFSLKGITVENVEKIARLAKKHGFGIAELRNKMGKITDEKISEIKMYAGKANGIILNQ